MKISQKRIAMSVPMSEQALSNILNGHRRPSWKIAKRLAVAVQGSTPEDWMESPPEALRQIINDYAQQERNAA